jgi:hypothetical protein
MNVIIAQQKSETKNTQAEQDPSKDTVIRAEPVICDLPEVVVDPNNNIESPGDKRAPRAPFTCPGVPAVWSTIGRFVKEHLDFRRTASYQLNDDKHDSALPDKHDRRTDDDDKQGRLGRILTKVSGARSACIKGNDVAASQTFIRRHARRPA